MSIGTIVTDEQIFPVQRMFLSGGEIIVEFYIPEGVSVCMNRTSWMLYDPAGMLVVRGAWSDVGIKVSDCEWHVTLNLAFTDKLTERARIQPVR